jgi:hypothetical protein
VQLRHLGFPADLRIRSLVVERLGQILNGLPFPLRDLVWVKLVLRRQFRDRPLAADRLKRHLRLELGRKPSAGLHPGSSFSSEDPPYAPVSETGPPQLGLRPFMTSCRAWQSRFLHLRESATTFGRCGAVSCFHQFGFSALTSTE